MYRTTVRIKQYVSFEQAVGVVPSSRDHNHNTWFAYCALYYAHAPLLKYAVADVVGLKFFFKTKKRL